MASAEDIVLHIQMEPENSFRAMLIRAKARGMEPRTIIDVGASNGQWSRMAHKIWPEASLLLIEANPVFTPALLDFIRENPGRRFGRQVLCAGYYDVAAKVRFAKEDPFQGVYPAGDGAGDWVEESNIDLMVKTAISGVAGLPGPYLIKLDVHGREHEILAGARETLKQTVGLVVEIYTWSQGANSMRAAELIPVIEMAHGFLPADLCEPLRRPLDGRLSQVDLLLEPASALHMDTARFK